MLAHEEGRDYEKVLLTVLAAVERRRRLRNLALSRGDELGGTVGDQEEE